MKRRSKLRMVFVRTGSECSEGHSEHTDQKLFF